MNVNMAESGVFINLINAYHNLFGSEGSGFKQFSPAVETPLSEMRERRCILLDFERFWADVGWLAG